MTNSTAVGQGRIADVLAGKRILLTGVTGFVGEALLERILFDLPDTRVVVVVRPRGGMTAAQRVEQLLTKPAFRRLRDRDGDGAVDALAGTRISILEGDLPNVPPLPGDLDVVVHCAGEVSFDPPIDEGSRRTSTARSPCWTPCAPRARRRTTCMCPRPTWPGAGRVTSGKAGSTTTSTGAPRPQRLTGSARWSKTQAGCRTASRNSFVTPNANTDAAATSPSRTTPTGADGNGSPSSSSLPAANAHEHWAGPTATRSPKRWLNARLKKPRMICH